MLRKCSALTARPTLALLLLLASTLLVQKYLLYWYGSTITRGKLTLVLARRLRQHSYQRLLLGQYVYLCAMHLYVYIHTDIFIYTINKYIYKYI